MYTMSHAKFVVSTKQEDSITTQRVKQEALNFGLNINFSSNLPVFPPVIKTVFPRGSGEMAVWLGCPPIIHTSEHLNGFTQKS